MHASGVTFSISAHAAWAPGVEDEAAWRAWAAAPHAFVAGADPGVRQMPAMLRRRAGLLGKMALEVAYRCLGEQGNIPSVFVSRHGDVGRAVELLKELADDTPLSPTSFGLAVHNAIGGLFSIARADRANLIALAAGDSGIEHAVIEACSLLADGAPAVLLVAYDCPLPAPLEGFEDCDEQPHAWAWLMVPAAADAIRLSWSPRTESVATVESSMPAALEVLRFQLGDAERLERTAGQQNWVWTRDA